MDTSLGGGGGDYDEQGGNADASSSALPLDSVLAKYLDREYWEKKRAAKEVSAWRKNLQVKKGSSPIGCNHS